MCRRAESGEECEIDVSVGGKLVRVGTIQGDAVSEWADGCVNKISATCVPSGQEIMTGVQVNLYTLT